MLHFIGIVSFGAPLPQAAVVEQAARRLGGADFGPVKSWRGQDCVLGWRMLPLRAETARASVPVLARDGARALIGSGRIDAPQELIAALALDSARPWSDTELMLASFARWGDAGADRLMGNFGFAVWDAAARRLTLAKDYFGTVPLFYHKGDGFAVFGSNPAALIGLGLVSRDLDAATLGENLTGRSADPEATLYKDLRRVRRGATVTINPAGFAQTIYWRPARGPVLRLPSDDAYVEATRAMLAEVLRGHLRATSPIGVMLSGGFDSAAIAATLAMLAPGRTIFGFTTVPVAGDPAYARGMGREWAHVQSLARMHGNLHAEAVAEKAVTPLDTDFRDFFADTGLPLTGIPLMTRRLALAQVARTRGVRTLMNGDAGNRTLTAEGEEIFDELFRAGRWLAFLREVWGTARFAGKSVRQVLWSEALRDIAPRGMLRAWRAARGAAPQPITEDTFLKPEFAQASGLLAKWRRAPNDPTRMELRRMREFEPVYLGVQPSHTDAMTLAYHRMGLEIAAPLRDRRLVDFVLRLPATQFRRNGVLRFLARRVLADRVPPETLGERGYFESFADQAHWTAGWWKEARRRLDDQHPAERAAAAIDLPALQAELGKDPPDRLPLYSGERKLMSAIANTVHINQFLRWHQGMND